MSASQFFRTHVQHLPQQFYQSAGHKMDQTELTESRDGLLKLVAEARQSTRHGSEAVKDSFVGGRRSEESWGLRKWISRHGNALRVCTDLECLLAACQKLERELETTRKLASILKPLAKQTLHQLEQQIPDSFQDRNASHLYHLPFFHRLEFALRSMSLFDPKEEAIVCIDD